MFDRENAKELLQKYEYGHLPKAPKAINAEITKTQSGNYMAGKGVLEDITLTCETENGKVVFPFQFLYRSGVKNQKAIIIHNFSGNIPNKYCPAEELLDMGWAIANINYNDVTPDGYKTSDNEEILKKGFNEDVAPGKIMLWAWGAMRVLDYFGTREEIDIKNVGVVGHSRLGKTALVTGAFDERFAFTHSNCSGTGGAGLYRMPTEISEKLVNLYDRVNSYGSTWFCKNLEQFVGNEKKLPFDQDLLLALIAPRVLSVGSATEDVWANPHAELKSAKKASRAWKALGLKGLRCPKYAEVGKNYHTGKVGYYERLGRHFFSREDYNRFLSFFERNLNK